MNLSLRSCLWCGTANPSTCPRCPACGLYFQSHASPGRDDEQPRYRVSRWLKQRYLIIRCVGIGGMGVVYEAIDGILHRRVALKKTIPNNAVSYQALTAVNAFQREAMILAQLDHLSLPNVYDYFSEKESQYLVMEWIAGVTLEAYLNEVPGKRLPINHVLALGIQLCAILDYLHTRPSPIIFRDLKPTNIMLTASGKLYLIDFGIARYFKPGAHQDTFLSGTSGYAAPEQYGWTQTTVRKEAISVCSLVPRKAYSSS